MFNQSSRPLPLTPPSASTSRNEIYGDEDDHDEHEGAGDEEAYESVDHVDHADLVDHADNIDHADNVDNVDDVDDGSGHAYTPIFSRNLSESWSDNTNMMARKIDFGTAHPNYNQPISKKAKWTDAELDVIKKWIQDNQSETKNKIAKCLAAIRLDISLHPIFHTRHVCDSARLKDGFDALARREGCSPQKKFLKAMEMEMKRHK